MRHAILIHTTPAARERWRALSEDERAACAQACRELERDLRERGELVLASTLRGPCRATARDLVAFYVVETETRERALEHAARLPDWRFGPDLVDVRALDDPEENDPTNP
jgi:hypothetical protein